MPADVLDQLQEKKLRGIEELLDSYHVAAAAGSGGDQEEAAIADFFVDEGIGLRQSILRLWDYHWTMALVGKIPDRREHGAKLEALLNRASRLLERNAAIARAYADLSGCEVARLAQFEEQCHEFPIWVEERVACWGLLDSPRKPYDHERAAEARAAFKRGDYEDVADILARLEKGGPLVKE
jgi:hypothetical protein